MFNASTEKIKKYASIKSDIIKQLNELLCGNVHVYIDYANLRPWSEHLEWNIDLERLKHFLDCFDNIKAVKFYYGTLQGDSRSEEIIKTASQVKYIVRTKPVKIINIPIEANSIDIQSPAILRNFIRKGLLDEYDLKTIEFLNNKFREMNRNGIKVIKDKKCNFDVEIGSDMVIDCEKNNIDCFVLWSGDSDFFDSVDTLLNKGKKVILFATARKVSSELNSLRVKGLVIFDIKKIKEFICWNRQLPK